MVWILYLCCEGIRNNHGFPAQRLERAMDSILASHQEYSAFHAMDRTLYSVLAIELWRNPHEAIQALALWICFERLGFKNIVQKILSLPRILINELADEALVCYRCIKDRQFLHSAKATDIPLTHSILEEKISLEYFHENRDSVIEGIWEVVFEVCATALTDVFSEATKRHSAQKTVKKPNTKSPIVEQSLFDSFASLGIASELRKGSSNGKRVSPALEQSLVHNFSKMGFAGEVPEGSTNSFANLGLVVSNGSTSVNMIPSALQQSLSQIFAKMGLKGQISGGKAGGAVPPRVARFLGHSFANQGHSGEISNGPAHGTPASPCRGQPLGRSLVSTGYGAEMSNGIRPCNRSPPENRTLFVTFSKGYPVTELEVREFFTQLFGDCIESFYMQPVMPHEQALYARVVFCKPDFVDLVLSGLQKAKYTINGKHLWMRKFIAKRAG